MKAVPGVRWRDRLGWSIKARLVALFLLLALGTTAVFLVGMQRLLQSGWEVFVQPLVADYADRLRDEIGSPPDAAKARAMTERLPITVSIEGPLLRFDSQTPLPLQRQARGRHGENSEADDHRHGRPFGIVRSTADGHRIRFGLARPPDELRPRLVGWTTLAALLALTALAYLMVRRMLAPLHAINAGVEAYGRGEFRRPIALARRDELGRLAERVDGMAANLHGMLEAKRGLLLAISHELRSPLTRARVNAELLDDSAPRQALLHDLAEMRDLIGNLLESERLAEGHVALQAESVDVAALASSLVQRNFSDRQVVLDLQDIGGPLQADPRRLELLLRNLIDNALRHGAAGSGNAAGAPPTVFLRSEAQGLVALGVRDHGSGVDDDQLAKLGQAFYRPDGARNRSTGGVGLGLALAKAVAEAHDGELRLRHAHPGLEVSAVWRPLRHG